MQTENQMRNLEAGKRFKTGEERTRAAGKKGGISSVEARRVKKSSRQMLAEIIESDLPKTRTTNQLLKLYGLDKGGDTRALSVILHALVIKAAEGDIKAAEFIIEMLDDIDFGVNNETSSVQSWIEATRPSKVFVENLFYNENQRDSDEKT